MGSWGRREREREGGDEGLGKETSGEKRSEQKRRQVRKGGDEGRRE